MLLAHLSMCACEKHGQIVLADGTRCPEFCLKLKAYEQLIELHRMQKITDEEFCSLESEILTAQRLALAEKDADPGVLYMCKVINETADISCHQNTEEDLVAT